MIAQEPFESPTYSVAAQRAFRLLTQGRNEELRRLIWLNREMPAATEGFRTAITTFSVLRITGSPEGVDWYFSAKLEQLKAEEAKTDQRMTAAQAAQQIGRTVQHVRTLIRSGKICGRKYLDGRWRCSELSAIRYDQAQQRERQ